MLTGSQVLDLPMNSNDAGADTVRDYLKKLLAEIWREGEGFSGKRPFGNSGWEHELYQALISKSDEYGSLDDDGYVDDYDSAKCDKAIFDAIAALN